MKKTLELAASLGIPESIAKRDVRASQERQRQLQALAAIAEMPEHDPNRGNPQRDPEIVRAAAALDPHGPAGRA